MSDPARIASSVHSAIISGLSGFGTIPAIKKEYREFEGVDLDVEVRKCGVASIDALLSSHPDMFERQGGGWRALASGDLNVVKLMATSKNKRGGGNIPRVSRGGRGGRGRGAPPRSHGAAFNNRGSSGSTGFSSTPGQFVGPSGFSKTPGKFSGSSGFSNPASPQSRFDSGTTNGFTKGASRFPDSSRVTGSSYSNNGRSDNPGSFNTDHRNQPRDDDRDYAPPNNMKPLFGYPSDPVDGDRGYDSRRGLDRDDEPYGRDSRYASQRGFPSRNGDDPDYYRRQPTRAYSPDPPKKNYPDENDYRTSGYRHDDDRGYQYDRYDDNRRGYFDDDDRIGSRNGMRNSDSYSRFDDGSNRDRDVDRYGGRASYRDDHSTRDDYDRVGRANDYDTPGSRYQGSSGRSDRLSDTDHTFGRTNSRATVVDREVPKAVYNDRRGTQSPTVSNRSSTRDDAAHVRRVGEEPVVRRNGTVEPREVTRTESVDQKPSSSAVGANGKKVKNTLSLSCKKIVAVLKQHGGGPLRDYELIRMIDEDQNQLPVDKYGGPFKLLKYCKEKRPEIMQNVVIEENGSAEGVARIWYKEDIVTVEERRVGPIKGGRDEKNVLRDLSEWMGDNNECSFDEAVQHLNISGASKDDKFVNLSMAILTDDFKAFKIDKSLGYQRIQRKDWSVREDVIAKPKAFQASEIHHWITDQVSLFEKRTKIPVRVVKMSYLATDINVILKEDFKAYDKMMEKIQIIVNNYEGPRYPLNEYKEGDGCLVLPSSENEKQEWFRAVVSGHDDEDDMLVVRLVDTGAIRHFDQADNVLPMPDSFLRISSFGLTCRLRAFVVNEENAETFDLRESVWVNMLKEGRVSIEPLSLKSNHLLVDMSCFNTSDEELNVLDKLEEEKLIYFPVDGF